MFVTVDGVGVSLPLYLVDGVSRGIGGFSPQHRGLSLRRGVRSSAICYVLDLVLWC